MPMETFNKTEWWTLAAGGLIIVIFAALIWQHASSSPAAPVTPSNNTSSMNQVSGKDISTDKRIQIIEVKEGTGAEAKNGSQVTVKYSGMFTDGKVFDSGSIPFALGSGSVIKGWDMGILGMKVGGQRRLIIQPELGYGSQTVGPIPANSVLVFDVELEAVK